jgi:hypothetical protein
MGQWLDRPSGTDTGSDVDGRASIGPNVDVAAQRVTTWKGGATTVLVGKAVCVPKQKSTNDAAVPHTPAELTQQDFSGMSLHARHGCHGADDCPITRRER